MATKRRLKNGSRRRRSQKLYKMKGCSRKKCKGGKKGSKGGWKGGKKTRGGVGPRKHLFVTYTGGADVVPVETQAPGNSVFGSQTGGCGCSTSLGGSGGQSGGSCGASMCPLQGGGSALVGSAWNPASPGQMPVPNHLALNTYSPVDISRQMLATGAQPPFSVGGARGGRRRRRGKSQKGGGLIDYPAYYGSALTSAFAGTSMPVSPSPIEGQFASTHSRV